MRVIVRSSPISAAGVFALERIPAGVRILEYTGARITHDEADALYETRPYTYLFGYGDGSHVIDGFGVSMYVNHSCAPNCETEEDEDGCVWITTLRDIAPGEELAYDYHLYDGDEDAPCYCGAKNCRGSMFSREELRRRARRVTAAAKKAK